MGHGLFPVPAERWRATVAACPVRNGSWAGRGSNPGPSDYESIRTERCARCRRPRRVAVSRPAPTGNRLLSIRLGWIPLIALQSPSPTAATVSPSSQTPHLARGGPVGLRNRFPQEERWSHDQKDPDTNLEERKCEDGGGKGERTQYATNPIENGMLSLVKPRKRYEGPTRGAKHQQRRNAQLEVLPPRVGGRRQVANSPCERRS